MEMFAAIYPAATSETRPGQLNTNFFSEASTDILDEEGSRQTIFYERTPSVLQVQQEMFASNKKPTLPLKTIYNLQPDKYKELNEKLVNSEMQVPFIIKWYGSEENQKENHIQINSFVEVTGFLYSSNPIQADSATEANETLAPVDMGVEGFEIDHYLNNYFAPSIHALSVSKLNPTITPSPVWRIFLLPASRLRMVSEITSERPHLETISSVIWCFTACFHTSQVDHSNTQSTACA